MTSPTTGFHSPGAVEARDTESARAPGLLAAHPVLRFLLRRGAWALVTLWIVSIIVFAATSVLSGNAARAVLGKNAAPATLHALEAELHLDRSVFYQYWYWLSHFVRGDFGNSAASVIGSDTAHNSIVSLIAGPAANSAVLAVITIAVMIPISLLIGVLAATRAGGWMDHVTAITSLTAISLPEFVTGTILVAIFATLLSWLPPVSLIGPGQGVFDVPQILILPILTLLAATVAECVRMVRSSVIDALDSDYVATARLAGLSERRIRYSYALRNALAPSVQVIALNMQWLVGGIVVVETVFSYPGLGRLFVSAVNLRDIPTTQSVALLLAAIYIALNILADLIITFLVPKLRLT